MRNKKNNTPIVVSSHDVHLDSDYVHQSAAVLYYQVLIYYPLHESNPLKFYRNSRK